MLESPRHRSRLHAPHTQRHPATTANQLPNCSLFVDVQVLRCGTSHSATHCHARLPRPINHSPTHAKSLGTFHCSLLHSPTQSHSTHHQFAPSLLLCGSLRKQASSTVSDRCSVVLAWAGKNVVGCLSIGRLRETAGFLLNERKQHDVVSAIDE